MILRLITFLLILSGCLLEVSAYIPVYPNGPMPQDGEVCAYQTLVGCRLELALPSLLPFCKRVYKTTKCNHRRRCGGSHGYNTVTCSLIEPNGEAACVLKPTGIAPSGSHEKKCFPTLLLKKIDKPLPLSPPLPTGNDPSIPADTEGDTDPEMGEEYPLN